MIHIKGKTTKTVCKTRLSKNDSTVIAAMASDCNECRAVLNIEPVTRDKAGVALNVRPVTVWTPQPYPNARNLRRK
jgi:hypothetical protein